METKIYARVAEETCPVTGLERVRLLRSTLTGFSHNMQPGTTVRTRYLDGGGTAVTTAGSYRSESELAFEAVPGRTQDVLDLGRLSLAASTLARQMGQHGPGNAPSAEQVAVWLRSYQGLLDWKKAAEQRMTKAQGEIDSIGVVLGQFL